MSQIDLKKAEEMANTIALEKTLNMFHGTNASNEVRQKMFSRIFFTVYQEFASKNKQGLDRS